MTRAVALALLLAGCAPVAVLPAGPLHGATAAAIRDCIVGGEPETVEDWRTLVLDCTE